MPPALRACQSRHRVYKKIEVVGAAPIVTAIVYVVVSLMKSSTILRASSRSAFNEHLHGFCTHADVHQEQVEIIGTMAALRRRSSARCRCSPPHRIG